VAAGGRYDGLVEEFGGPRTPGIGFAIGMERIIPLIKDSVKPSGGPDLFICPLGLDASEQALVLAEQLRAHGLRIEANLEGTSIRRQMRKADRIGAKNVIVLGEDEIRKGEVVVKDMIAGTETKTSLAIQELAGIIREKK